MATIKHRYGRYAVIDTGLTEHKYVSAEVRISPSPLHVYDYDVIGVHSNESDAKFAAESYSKNNSLLESLRPKQWINL